MLSRGNPSATAKQAIPKAYRWQRCVTVSHTFDAMVPPAQLLSRQCATRTSGLPYAAPISRHPSAPWSAQPTQPLASHHKVSACAPSVRGGQWHSSRHALTWTRSGSLGGGGATQLSATSTLHQKSLRTTSPSVCSNTATTRSSCQNMPPASNKQYRWIHAPPPSRVFMGPGTGLVWTWQFINSLFTQTPSHIGSM